MKTWNEAAEFVEAELARLWDYPEPPTSYERQIYLQVIIDKTDDPIVGLVARLLKIQAGQEWVFHIGLSGRQSEYHRQSMKLLRLRDALDGKPERLGDEAYG